MTVEELLEDRYKVMANYPQSPYKIGDLVIMTATRCLLTVTKEFSEWEVDFVNVEHYVTVEELNEYPALFTKIPWWQERKVEDMPKCVKQTGMVDSLGKTVPYVYRKIKKHFSAGNGEWRDDLYRIFASDIPFAGGFKSYNYDSFEPTTESEYLSYQNTLTPNQLK